MSPEATNQIANAGIHIIILSLFWVVLYDKLAFPIARQALTGQVQQVVSVVSQKGDDAIPQLRYLRTQDSSSYDVQTDASEKSKHTNQLQILKILTILAATIGVLYVTNRNNPGVIGWKTLLKENALLFAGVGVIEYWFFTRIAQHYVPILPSDISDITKQRVLEYGHC